MERVRRGLDISKEYLGYLKGVIGGDVFKDDLEKAGSIAAMVSLGLKLYEHTKEAARTEDEKAFNSLIKFTFEAAKETISNPKSLSIKNITSKEIKENLYSIFVNAKEESNNRYWDSYYLPSHPIVKEFKKLFRELLESEGYRELVQEFMIDFSMRIEEKADHDDNRVFKQWSDHIKNKKRLTEYLQRTSAMIYKVNPVDKKYLAEYYVENNAVVADIHETWDEKDEYFSKYMNKDSEDLRAINIVLKSVNKRNRYDCHEEDNRYTIVASPFGIGKTSLATYIASTLAAGYLDGESLINDDNNSRAIDPSNNGDHISYRDHLPVFIALKDVDENGSYIERKLQSIFIAPQSKKRNILLMCDGLDEYNFEEIKLKQVLDNLSTDNNYPNIHFLITTRLEAGMQKLHTGLEKYIRLLPFNQSQVDTFFTRYGTPQYSFDKISQYGLGDEEKRKPLFCWMIALNPNSERFLQQSATVTATSNDKSSTYLTMALLYQDFIHSLIIAKHRDVGTGRGFSEYYTDEKNLLRKIAAIKQSCESTGDILTVSKVIELLRDYFGLDYSENSRKEILNLVLTSYFYLAGKNTRDKTLDFIHKSFKEHLLAEYYIETMLDYHNKHHLNVGIPYNQTINHIEGLLGILKNENDILKDQKDNFIISLKRTQRNGDVKEILAENALKIFQGEEIVTFNPKGSAVRDGKANDKGWWNLIHISDTKYGNLWIHRWLALYVLNILVPKNNINKTVLSNFIRITSYISSFYLKRFVGANLSGANLSGANLSGANLSGVDLSGANLTRADLFGANLSGANLSDASLWVAYLSEANLSGANLSVARLLNADLSHSNLFDTNISSANLSGANLSDTNLSYAKISYANLSGANLSGANLLNADLSHSNLFRADLFGANLSGANLSGAIHLPISKDVARSRGATV